LVLTKSKSFVSDSLEHAFHVCRSRRRSIAKVAGMERSHIRRAAATAAAAILLCLVSDGSIVVAGSGSSFRNPVSSDANRLCISDQQSELTNRSPIEGPCGRDDVIMTLVPLHNGQTSGVSHVDLCSACTARAGNPEITPACRCNHLHICADRRHD
jgi:hypothetical protein